MVGYTALDTIPVFYPAEKMRGGSEKILFGTKEYIA